MTVNALILMGVVFGLTEMVKAVVPDDWEVRSWVKVISAFAVSLLAVYIVAETRWAETSFFGDAALDTMDWAEKIVFAFFIAGGAALTQRTVKAVSNMGQNVPTAIQEKALDAGAERLVAAQLRADQGGSHDNGEPPQPAPVDLSGFTYEEQ